MTGQIFLLQILILGLTLLFLGQLVSQIEHLKRANQRQAKVKGKRRQLRAQTPKECVQCQAQDLPPARDQPPEVIPWRERKSRAGRSKQLNSEGVACPNEDCDYHRVSDAEIHAIVGNGKRGQCERIQQWRCQACGTDFSARVGTPLYRLKTGSKRVAEVLTALAEGVDLSSASRIFGHHPNTISRWLGRAGEHSERLHQRTFRQIVAAHLQLDELTTRVKQGGERVWLWTAVEAQSKIILTWQLGQRSKEYAFRLIHDLKGQLTADCRPVFTSDGLALYFYALSAHYGTWWRPPRARKDHWRFSEDLLYGQVRKVRSGYRLKHIYTLVLAGERTLIRTALQAIGLTGRIQTAFVERTNLTLRQLVAPLSRRTWSMAYDQHHLRLHLEWGRAYYHFVRPHLSLRRPLANGRYRKRTPTMAAGLTQRPWTVRDLLRRPLLPEPG